jgi:hypothetical protein
MNKQSVISAGKQAGYDIASSNLYDILNPKSYTQEDLDEFADDMIAHESDIYRQYSPFEFFAHDINNSKYPDELWDAYNNAVWQGIWKRIKEFKRENWAGFVKEEASQ